MLKKVNLSEEYFSHENNLVEAFYRPCISEAIEYDRSVGYFRSSVFIMIIPEIVEFVKRGGRIRLVCSPYLTDDDIESIRIGYDDKYETVCRALYRDIDALINNELISNNVRVLATLVSLNVMEVKIAFLPEDLGNYHVKLGIFADESNNIVVFKGSVNETWNGWHERGNHETLDVFCSWRDSGEFNRVIRNRDYFQNLWSNQDSKLEVIPFPVLGIEKLKSIANDSLEDIDPSDIVDYYRYRKRVANQKHEKKIPSKDKRKPLKHQLDAIVNWKMQNKRGILEHATGSGKTFTALIAIKEHLDTHGVVLVLVPDQLLHRQWSDELDRSIDELHLLKAGAGHNDWKEPGRLYTFTSPLVSSRNIGKRVLLVTMQTACKSNFLSSINDGEHIMLVADEVHEVGSNVNSNALSISSGPRLGLSATPKRYGDPEGTTRILDYFGSVVQPPYTLVDAIQDRRLVPYEYFPSTVCLSSTESDDWATQTNEISKEFARSKRDENGEILISPFLRNLFIRRSRIAKKAEEKIPLTVKILKENYHEGQSWLVYCEDQVQLSEVRNRLIQEGFEPLEYHTNMDSDDTATLEYYKNFGGILCSIRCLDQGVDIPKISHAIILASSQNPRQFIQRRGRVLRICEGKHKSVIYDAVVLPVSLEDEPTQLSLLKGEFQRAIQFAGTALNSSAKFELKRLAIELRIDPEAVGIMESDGIEEDESYDKPN